MTRGGVPRWGAAERGRIVRQQDAAMVALQWVSMYGHFGRYVQRI